MTLLAGRPWEIRARRLAVLAVLFGLVALASGGVLSRSADGAAAASASQSGRKSPRSGLPVAARGAAPERSLWRSARPEQRARAWRPAAERWYSRRATGPPFTTDG